MPLQYNGVGMEGGVGKRGYLGGLRACWDCGGQRRVTEQHTENGSIIPLCWTEAASGCKRVFLLPQKPYKMLTETETITYSGHWLDIYSNKSHHIELKHSKNLLKSARPIKKTTLHLSNSEGPRSKLRRNKLYMKHFLSARMSIIMCYFTSTQYQWDIIDPNHGFVYTSLTCCSTWFT